MLGMRCMFAANLIKLGRVDRGEMEITFFNEGCEVQLFQGFHVVNVTDESRRHKVDTYSAKIRNVQ